MTEFRDLTPTKAREKLAVLLRELNSGEQVKAKRVSLETFWPNPDIFQRDDHLEVKERADKWCEAHGVTVYVDVDPPGLTFVRPNAGSGRADSRPIKPALRQLGASPSDRASRADLLQD